MDRAILVAVDFSEHGQAAMDAGRRLAQDLKARMVLVHAVEPFPRAVATRPEVQHGIEQAKEEIGTGDAVTLSEEWAEAARKDGIDVTPVVQEGKPTALILEQAKEHGVELIVVGTHGRTGLQRALMGSVAESVVRGSEVPVLVVPKP